MKTKKVLIVIVSFLLLLSIGCTVVGYLHKDKQVNNNYEDNNTQIHPGDDYNYEIPNIKNGCKNFEGQNYEEIKNVIDEYAKDNGLEIKVIRTLATFIDYDYIDSQKCSMEKKTLELYVSDNKYYAEGLFEESFPFEDSKSEYDVSKLELDNDDEVVSTSDKYISVFRRIDARESESELIDIKTYKTLLSAEAKQYDYKYKFFGNYVLLVEVINSGDSEEVYHCIKVYTSGLKELASNADDVVFINGNVGILVNKTYTIYDKNGKQVSKYNNVEDIFDRYIILKEKNEYKLLSLDGSKVTIAKENNNLSYYDTGFNYGYLMISFVDSRIDKERYLYECENDCYEENALDSSFGYGYTYYYQMDEKVIEQKEIDAFESWVNDVDPDEEDTDEESNSVYDGIIGILFNGYRPFENLKFDTIVKSNSDGKILSINGNTTTYQDLHASTKKLTANTPNVKSAGLVCDCGSCVYLYYINNNNELYYIDFEENETKKLADNIIEMGSFSNADVNASTCSSDNLIFKNSEGKVFIITGDGLTPIEKAERSFIATDDEWQAILYMVSENAKVDDYLKDDKNNRISAIAAVEDKNVLYVLSEDNYIYVFDNWYTTKVPKKYSENKIVSYKINDEYLDITFENQKVDRINGTVYAK